MVGHPSFNAAVDAAAAAASTTGSTITSTRTRTRTSTRGRFHFSGWFVVILTSVRLLLSVHHRCDVVML